MFAGSHGVNVRPPCGLTDNHGQMSTTETAVVGAALAVGCPLLTFVAFWRGSAVVSSYVTTIESALAEPLGG